MTAVHRVLVLVHPGSACGSANHHIGKFEARAARDSLCHELDNWRGDVLVIDGDFSDEIVFYPSFDLAISDCLQRNRACGFECRRVVGDDPDQVLRIREYVAGLEERSHASFQVTGAWWHPDDGSGCVGSVLDELQRLGLPAKVADSAVVLDPELQSAVINETPRPRAA